MHKINLLEEMKRGHYIGGVYHAPKRPRFLKFLTFFLIFLTVIFFSFSWMVFSSYRENKNSDSQNQEAGIISNISRGIKNLVTFGNLSIGNSKNLKGEKEGRINVLLLGIGGKGHDGPYLSDTIIIASIEPSTGKVALISVPRDLYVPIGEYGWKKINHANAYGEMDKPGFGAPVAAETVSKVFNIPIHYYIRVDFQGFQKIIDDLGGIKIYVENSFTDAKYPDNNYGYEPISFTQGFDVMSGDRALKYARSRHGDNGEGSDFARSRRQQKVLTAVKEKMSGFNFWLNPGKIGQVLADLDNHIGTDMDAGEVIDLAKIIKKSDLDNINHIVLSDGPEGQLYATNINGEYVLLPKGNDFTILKVLAKNILSANTSASSPKKEIPASVEIQNGTLIAGLASQKAKELKDEGFIITKIGNASNQNYTETAIYDLTQNSSAEETEKLKKKFNAPILKDIPSYMISENIGGINTNSSGNLTDFIIILGKDADN